MLYEKYHYQQQQMLYNANVATSNYIQPIVNYTTNISLREFPEYTMYDPTKNYVGCYIGLSFSTFADHFLYYNNPNWIKEFWYFTVSEIICLHSILIFLMNPINELKYLLMY